MTNETFEQLEAKLDLILNRTTIAAKSMLTIDDVAFLTGLSKSYLYRLTCERKIPYYKPNGKLMYFDRGEIEAQRKKPSARQLIMSFQVRGNVRLFGGQSVRNIIRYG